MCDEKLKEIQSLEATLEHLIRSEMSIDEKIKALGNSYWRSHNTGYCDYMAGQRMAGVDDDQVHQHNLDWKYRYEVERLLDLLTELKNEEFDALWKKARELFDEDNRAGYQAWLKLSEQGYARATHSVAWCYRFGNGVVQDTEKAKGLYKQAIDGGFDRSYSALFGMLEEEDKLPEAHALALEGARKGSSECYSLLAFECEFGRLFGGNARVAAYLAARAYELDKLNGHMIGYYYLKGYYFPQVYPYAKYCIENSWLTKQSLEEEGMEFPEFWDDIQPVEPSYPDFGLTLDTCDNLPDPVSQFQEAQQLFYGDNPDVDRGKELLRAAVEGGYAAAMYRMFLKDMPDYEQWLKLGAEGYGELRCIETLAALYTDCVSYTTGDPYLEIATYYWDLREKLHPYIPVDELVVDFYNDYNIKSAWLTQASAPDDSNAILLRADGSYKRITVDFDTLQGLYAPLNCDRINAISTRRLSDISMSLGFSVVMYCDERGMPKHLPENKVAAELSGYQVLWGDVVICGFKKDYAPLSKDQIAKVEKLLASPDAQSRLRTLADEVVSRPAPDTCQEIAELLEGLPPKSWVHRQAPTPEQNKALALLKAKESPTPEELRYMAEICCGKYHRIREDGWSLPQREKAKELYGQYYEITGNPDVKYILDSFDEFLSLCCETVSHRQREDDLASVNDGSVSTSRDPDSTEWKEEGEG